MNRKIVHDAVEKNLNTITLAIYSMILVNDIACTAVVDLEEELKKHKDLFRQDVKYKFGLLKNQYLAYTHRFNSLTGKDVGDFCDWSDAYNDEVMSQYHTLHYTYINAFLKANLPKPYLLARLLYTRDCIYMAIANYNAWLTQIHRDAPQLKGRLDLSNRSVKSWEQAYINLSNTICDALHLDGVFEVDTEKIDMCQKIIIRSVCDANIVAKALGLTPKENGTES